MRKFSEILDLVGETNPDVLILSEAEVYEPPILNGFNAYTELVVIRIRDYSYM